MYKCKGKNRCLDTELQRELESVRGFLESIERKQVDILLYKDMRKLLLVTRHLKDKGKFRKADLKKYKQELPQKLHLLLSILFVLVNGPLGNYLIMGLKKILASELLSRLGLHEILGRIL